MDKKTAFLGFISFATVFLAGGCLFVFIYNNSKSHSKNLDQQISINKAKDNSSSNKIEYSDSKSAKEAKLSITGEYAVPMVPVALILVAIVVICAIPLLLYHIIRLYSSCPKCKKMYYQTMLSRIVLSSERRMGLVTRHSESFGSVYIPGHHGKGKHCPSHNSTFWKERVPMIYQRIETTYECKYCKYTWSKIDDESFEDFS